jgi:hypothetical protein
MATTHVLIVNEDSFPIHLNFLFVGTGAKNNDFHYGLLADLKRVREGDLVIFYLEKVGFFGIFEIAGQPFKDNGKPTYLENLLGKKLIYRVKIKPKKVYPFPISEWEALDKLPLYAKDVIWSLIYRKLKGWRGCTPINLQESENLIKLLLDANKSNEPISLNTGESFTYNSEKKIIEKIRNIYPYTKKSEPTENVLEEMINLDKKHRAFEDRLQIYFCENVGKIKFLEPITGKSEDIIWLGNEVYCGFGMQKIDIFTILSDERKNIMLNLIELKCIPAYPEIKYQLKRYADWAQSYIKGAINTNIQPVLVTRKVRTGFMKNGNPYKVQIKRDNTKNALTDLNSLNISQKVKWFEYDFKNNDILFEEVSYE